MFVIKVEQKVTRKPTAEDQRPEYTVVYYKGREEAIVSDRMYCTGRVFLVYEAVLKYGFKTKGGAASAMKRLNAKYRKTVIDRKTIEWSHSIVEAYGV